MQDFASHAVGLVRRRLVARKIFGEAEFDNMPLASNKIDADSVWYVVRAVYAPSHWRVTTGLIT